MNINQVWPEWNEDCVLGEGSFGKVYRAKRVEYGRTFYSAIKVLTVPKSAQEIRFARSQGMNDAEIYSYFKGLVENLLNEITLMDNLKGAKNIVGIEDYKIIEREGEIGWEIFIRMELLTPFDSFAVNPNFSQYDVIKLGVDICSALESCEQNHIIHRDIKPDNIFVSRFGEYKLGDFGIARKLEASQANLSKKGTLNYMAPEIYKGENYFSNVDIYSLGLVLYTLLNNNRVPFLPPCPQPITYNDNETALYKRLSGEQMAMPCNAAPSLGNVILKACAYRPEERFHTATEFKNALLNAWNHLQQTGMDYRIMPAQGVQQSHTDGQGMTMNDMTARGQVVASGRDNGYNTSAYNAAVDYSKYSGKGSMGMPGIYGKSKSSKIAKILAYPLAVITAVLGFAAFSSADENLLSVSAIVSVLALAVAVFLSSENKKAIGICLTVLSAVHIIPSAQRLFMQLNEGFPIDALILFVCGLLLLFGGIVKIAQKEDRLSASILLYSVFAYIAYCVFLVVKGSFVGDITGYAVTAAALTGSVWSFGYSKNAESDGLHKILHIVTYIVCIAAAAVSAGLIAKYTGSLFG